MFLGWSGGKILYVNENDLVKYLMFSIDIRKDKFSCFAGEKIVAMYTCYGSYHVNI